MHPEKSAYPESSTLHYAREEMSLKLDPAADTVVNASPTAMIVGDIRKIRGPRATIDEQLEADLEIADGNRASGHARKAVKDKHAGVRMSITNINTIVSEDIAPLAQHTSNKKQGRFIPDQALAVLDENEVDVPDSLKTRKSKHLSSTKADSSHRHL